MSPAAPGIPPESRRPFAPRPVALERFPELVRESAALLGAAPARLCGLFLVVFFAILVLSGLPNVALPLRSTIASVGYAGFFVGLESARQGRPPTFAELAVPWRLPCQPSGTAIANPAAVPAALGWLYQ